MVNINGDVMFHFNFFEFMMLSLHSFETAQSYFFPIVFVTTEVHEKITQLN